MAAHSLRLCAVVDTRVVAFTVFKRSELDPYKYSVGGYCAQAAEPTKKLSVERRAAVALDTNVETAQTRELVCTMWLLLVLALAGTCMEQGLVVLLFCCRFDGVSTTALVRQDRHESDQTRMSNAVDVLQSQKCLGHPQPLLGSSPDELCNRVANVLLVRIGRAWQRLSHSRAESSRCPWAALCVQSPP
eukprot:4759133-Amphidinium_carterae.1